MRSKGERNRLFKNVLPITSFSDLEYESVSTVRLPCIAMLQRFSVEPDSANPHWRLVARRLAIQGGYGEPVFGRPSWYLDRPKLRDWRYVLIS